MCTRFGYGEFKRAPKMAQARPRPTISISISFRHFGLCPLWFSLGTWNTQKAGVIVSNLKPTNKMNIILSFFFLVFVCYFSLVVVASYHLVLIKIALTNVSLRRKRSIPLMLSGLVFGACGHFLKNRNSRARRYPYTVGKSMNWPVGSQVALFWYDNRIENLSYLSTIFRLFLLFYFCRFVWQTDV